MNESEEQQSSPIWKALKYIMLVLASLSIITYIGFHPPVVIIIGIPILVWFVYKIR